MSIETDMAMWGIGSIYIWIEHVYGSVLVPLKYKSSKIQLLGVYIVSCMACVSGSSNVCLI